LQILMKERQSRGTVERGKFTSRRSSPPMPHSLGWYHTPTPTGFVLHLSATPDHLRATRALIGKTLADAECVKGNCMPCSW
jgi:hypothetical protein